MAFTHTASSGWSNGSRSIIANKNYSSELQTSIDQAIADSETDFEIVVGIDVSQIVHIYIKCDQDITIETNDGTTPADTINLKADVPYVFNADLDAYFTDLLTTDVTSLFITNASGSTANLQLEVLTDPTP